MTVSAAPCGNTPYSAPSINTINLRVERQSTGTTGNIPNLHVLGFTKRVLELTTEEIKTLLAYRETYGTAAYRELRRIIDSLLQKPPEGHDGLPQYSGGWREVIMDSVVEGMSFEEKILKLDGVFLGNRFCPDLPLSVQTTPNCLTQCAQPKLAMGKGLLMRETRADWCGQC
ncbi:hypothetical protein BC835DRAFT_1307360 [Cytidiella melzeri]|nr:hypothetical protein BC835DRAFT_1307360 [Cytidiella melzeri]